MKCWDDQKIEEIERLLGPLGISIEARDLLVELSCHGRNYVELLYPDTPCMPYMPTLTPKTTPM